MNRETLPGERNAFTRKFVIRYIDENEAKCELKFYVLAGMYEDGRLGEIFIRGDRVGSFITGALDALAMTISLGLQHGVPLNVFTAKLRHNRFGPSGFTGDPDFPSCTSAFDLIAQYLDRKFPDGKLVDQLQGRVDPTEQRDSTPVDPDKETP